MSREHRIISALQGSAVPVAPALGLCLDPAVNGAPFYMMQFVAGNILRDQHSAERLLTPLARRHDGESLIETMASIHAVDINAVGLGDLARHEAYIERQLKRWYGQFNAQKTRDRMLVGIPLDRFGEPEDVARAAVFLVSDGASWII